MNYSSGKLLVVCFSGIVYCRFIKLPLYANSIAEQHYLEPAHMNNLFIRLDQSATFPTNYVYLLDIEKYGLVLGKFCTPPVFILE